MYFDPWAQSLAGDLARVFRQLLPSEVTVLNLPSGLVIFRREKVRPILDADRAFYRPSGEDDLAAIERVCARGDNGELLGYGARNWFEPHGTRVIIRDFNRMGLMFFVSDPAKATYFARERLMDIATYTGAPLYYELTEGNS